MSPPKILIKAHSNNWLSHSLLFTNDLVHGFICESGVVFNFIQRVSRDLELLSFSETVDSSRKYRSVIHSWYIKLLEELSNNEFLNDDTKKLELQQLTRLMREIEIVWHLCEVIFINVQSPGTLLFQLLEWVKWHFTYYVDLAQNVISEQNEPVQLHENYWDLVMFFALRGEMENAQLILKLHSESKTDPFFATVDSLLKKFPLISNTPVFHEYYLRWGLWRENLLQTIAENQNTLSTQKKSYQCLNLLLRLLAGDLEAFQSVGHLFHSWYQLLVSYVLFSNPCLKGDIDSLIDKCINIYYSTPGRSQQKSTILDELVRSALNYDLIDVIKQSCLCFPDNWWFVTHFVDLIFNSQRYQEYSLAEVGSIRESVVKDYADSLFAKGKQFWQLSIQYLSHSKDSQQHVYHCLERVPFDDERELQKILFIVRKFNFGDLEQSLCRIQSRKWIRIASTSHSNKCKYGSALFWAIRSKDKMLINHIVDQYLEHYLQTSMESAVRTQNFICDGKFLDEDVISNVGGLIVSSERLIFLCKYFEFHQLYRDQQLSQAAKILIDMLFSNAIPEFFIFQVILDCFRLLQLEDVIIFDSQQSCKILESLERLLTKFEHWKRQTNPSKLIGFLEKSENLNDDDRWSKIRKYQQTVLEKFEIEIRTAIAQNLSKSFVNIIEN